MRRVAVLSYYFPPIGGAGAQRPARFVRYLRDFGWDPVVVTGPGATDDRWTPRDEALYADIPDDVEVRRLDGPEPSVFLKASATKNRRPAEQPIPFALARDVAAWLRDKPPGVPVLPVHHETAKAIRADLGGSVWRQSSDRWSRRRRGAASSVQTLRGCRAGRASRSDRCGRS